MYSTCLFCRSALGANETFETFPVGRRLAYDAATGRLWVVCPHCARWNLTPLEERWETIDAAERRMERVRVRASSGEITLGRLAEGTELVRIGKPVARELATWRYGDQFGRRRRRNLVIGGSIAVVGGLAGIAASGAIAIGVGSYIGNVVGGSMGRVIREGPQWMPVARLRAPDGSLLAIRPPHLRATSFGHTAAGEAEVTIHFDSADTLLGRKEPVTFTGAAAERALASLLPAANRLGGTKDDIELALARLNSAKSPRHMIARLATSRTNFTPLDDAKGWDRVFDSVRTELGLYAMPPGIALAIEMALHADQEQAAMEGELAALESAWREAEEIARIADDLFLPAEVVGSFERMKRKILARAAG